MQQTIGIECPHCGEPIAVVVPEAQTQQQEGTNTEAEHLMNAELVHWAETERPTDPYTANDTDFHPSQQVEADIRIDGKLYSFTFWYTPRHDGFSYVVRTQLETGVKSKDVYPSEDGLAINNRGVPRDSDKQWTYLSEDECRRRSRIAGLGDIRKDPRHEDKDNRFHILLGEQERPFVEDGEIAEELLLKLAKGLVVFQTAR